jgi:hypothetical protein
MSNELIEHSWWDVPLRTPRELAEEYRAMCENVEREGAACPYLGGFKKPWDYTCTAYLVTLLRGQGQFYTKKPWEVEGMVPVLPFQTMMAVAIFDEPKHLDEMLEAKPEWEPQALAAAISLYISGIDPVRGVVAEMDLLGADLMAEWALRNRPQRLKQVTQLRGGRHSDWAVWATHTRSDFKGWLK